MKCELTVLLGELAALCGDVRIDTLGLLVRKFREIVPVSLQGIGNLVCCLRISELEDGIVVEGPVLGLPVLAPDLFSFNTKDLQADTTRCRNVVRNDLWSQRGVAHNAVVGAGRLKHALREVLWEVTMDGQSANDTLLLSV